MPAPFYDGLRLGVLGGGQLGRMFLRAAIDFSVRVAVLDPHPLAPCRPFCADFAEGDFRDHDTVLNFGRLQDVLTIEIENVNAGALAQLEQDGILIRPGADLVALVQDKGLQKQFYHDRGFPTAPFRLLDSTAELSTTDLPVVQKIRRGGFDGRGVQVLRKGADLARAFDAPAVIEDLVPIERELSILVARNPQGDVAAYPPVGMSFHPTANLVEFLEAPAELPPEVVRHASNLACELAETLQLVGLLAVELFLDTDGNLLINEIAPRPHNSGHHTIEANVTSQFEQHLRAILGLPLGDVRTLSPAVMVNLLGSEAGTGAPRYEGLEDVLAMPGVALHLYGKAETRPNRKMGHLTVLGENLEEAKTRARRVRDKLRVVPATEAPH